MRKLIKVVCGVMLVSIASDDLHAMLPFFSADDVCEFLANPEEVSAWRWDDLCHAAEKKCTRLLAERVSLLPISPEWQMAWECAQQAMGVPADSYLPAFVLPECREFANHRYLVPAEKHYVYLNTNFFKTVPYGAAWFELCKVVARINGDLVAPLGFGESLRASDWRDSMQRIDLAILQRCSCWRCLDEVACKREHDDVRAGTKKQLMSLSAQSRDTHVLLCNAVVISLIYEAGFDELGYLRAWVLQFIAQKLKKQGCLCSYHQEGL